MADPKKWGEGWNDGLAQPTASEPAQPKWGEGWTDATTANVPASYQTVRRWSQEATAAGNKQWDQPGLLSKPMAAAELIFGGMLAQVSANPVTPASGDPTQPVKEWLPTYLKTEAGAEQLIAQGNQDWAKHTFWAKPMAALELIGGGMDWALSPVTASFKTFLGDPFERSTGIPGSSDFVSSAANTAVSFTPTAKVVDAIGLFGNTKVADSALKLLSPTARLTLMEKEALHTGLDFLRPGAVLTEESIRAMTSYIARDTEMADAEIGKFRKLVGGMSFEAKVDFIHAIETGAVQTDPSLQPMADFLRRILDERRARIQSLGTGRLADFIENYFPHIWKDPARAAQVFSESKRPLKGSGAFLKQRTIETVKEGLDRGLELFTDNPLDLVAIKLREMDRFYYGSKMIEELKANGILRFVRRGARVPPGLTRLDDPAFKILVRNDPEVLAEMKAVAEAHGVDTSAAPLPGQFADVGEWYAPEPAARVLNNYLSKGIGITALADTAKFFRSLGNGMSSAQLALSAFHFTFTSNDGIISRIVTGMRQASHGELLRAAKTIGSAPIAPIRNIIRGGKLRAAYLNPGGATPQMQRMVEALVEAGGRINMDNYWRMIGTRPIIKSLRDGTYLQDTIEELKGTGLAMPFKLATKVLQDITAPLMEWWVPRQKLAVFSNMAEDYLRNNPTASTLELRAGLKASWDSVDNRMGQMVYDNLFWSKTLKDISHIFIRAVGWNLGTVRELGGAFVDLTGNLRTIAGRSQKQLEFTERMGYAIALPIVHALEGAVLTYLFTGKGPQEALDYFYPPTGQTLPNGHKQRVSIPDYMKDVVAWKTDPVTTAQNKLSPWIASTIEMLQNKDFYNSYITDPDAGFITNVLDYAAFAAKQFTPFSVTAAGRLRQSGAGPGESAMSFLGFQPPPGYITDPEGTQRRYERQLMQERRKKAREKYAAARGEAAAEAATTPAPPGWGEGWK